MLIHRSFPTCSRVAPNSNRRVRNSSAQRSSRRLVSRFEGSGGVCHCPRRRASIYPRQPPTHHDADRYCCRTCRFDGADPVQRATAWPHHSKGASDAVASGRTLHLPCDLYRGGTRCAASTMRRRAGGGSRRRSRGRRNAGRSVFRRGAQIEPRLTPCRRSIRAPAKYPALMRAIRSCRVQRYSSRFATRRSSRLSGWSGE